MPDEPKGAERFQRQMSRDLINAEAVQRRERDWIGELAGRFLKTVKHGRRETAA
jgi:hypothetical protein